MSENIGGTQSTRGNGSAAEAARESYTQAKQAARQMYDQARERASTYYEEGKSKAVDYQHQVEDAVRAQPVKSVLIAAGAGLLIGMLLRRM